MQSIRCKKTYEFHKIFAQDQEMGIKIFKKIMQQTCSENPMIMAVSSQQKNEEMLFEIFKKIMQPTCSKIH
jgi:hypothetical protein